MAEAKMKDGARALGLRGTRTTRSRIRRAMRASQPDEIRSCTQAPVSRRRQRRSRRQRTRRAKGQRSRSRPRLSTRRTKSQARLLAVERGGLHRSPQGCPSSPDSTVPKRRQLHRGLPRGMLGLAHLLIWRPTHFRRCCTGSADDVLIKSPNQFVYYVTNALNVPWTRLPDVKPVTTPMLPPTVPATHRARSPILTPSHPVTIL